MIQRLRYKKEWTIPDPYPAPYGFAEPLEQRIVISEEYDDMFAVLDASMDGPARRLADLPHVIEALQSFQRLYEARKLDEGG
jgi:hypothetical protein